MQISRRFLLACTATAILFPSILVAQETEAQIKAREALERKIKEVEAQSSAAPAAPAAVAEPKPAKSQKPAKTQAAPPPVAATLEPEAPPVVVIPATAQVTTAPPAADADAIERAREALREKMGQPQAAPVVQTSKTTKANAKSDAAIQQAVVESQKAASEKAAQPTQPAHAQSTAKTKEVHAAKPRPVALETIQAPPSGLATAKEQRLHDLLEQYKADSLTPEQYHAERAKILSEP